LILVQRLFQLFENFLAALNYFTKLNLLLLREVSLWENIIDISKDVRKVFDPVMQKLAYWHAAIRITHSLEIALN
jgi:K+-sensing histidine kinase KdpD